MKRNRTDKKPINWWIVLGIGLLLAWVVFGLLFVPSPGGSPSVVGF